MLITNVVQREPAMYFCDRVSENNYMNKEGETCFVSDLIKCKYSYIVCVYDTENT